MTFFHNEDRLRLRITIRYISLNSRVPTVCTSFVCRSAELCTNSSLQCSRHMIESLHSVPAHETCISDLETAVRRYRTKVLSTIRKRNASSIFDRPGEPGRPVARNKRWRAIASGAAV